MFCYFLKAANFVSLHPKNIIRPSTLENDGRNMQQAKDPAKLRRKRSMRQGGMWKVEGVEGGSGREWAMMQEKSDGVVELLHCLNFFAFFEAAEAFLFPARAVATVEAALQFYDIIPCTCLRK